MTPVEVIALEHPEIKAEMLACVEEVRGTGHTMSFTAKEFANDPCSSVKRGKDRDWIDVWITGLTLGNMVRASRNLLSAVTRLLIMADMIDVHLLMKKLRRVEDDLEFLKSVSSQVSVSILESSYHCLKVSLSHRAPVSAQPMMSLQ